MRDSVHWSKLALCGVEGVYAQRQGDDCNGNELCEIPCSASSVPSVNRIR